MAQIRLESRNARIKIDTQKPVQSIEQPQAELDLQQPPAEMTIERTPYKLTIDQTKAREDVDLKSVFKRTEEAAQLGYQDLLDGISRSSQDGDELMMIENGGDAISAQAKRNSEDPMYEFNIGWIPSHHSVKIEFTPGKVDIDVKMNKAINNTKPKKAVHDYQPGKVNISLQQYHSLTIDFANLKYKGINFEQEI